MNAATLALLIPIVAIVGGVVLSAMKIQQRKGQAQQQDAVLQALQEEISALKARVQVLEALATDSGESLKRKINDL